MRLHLYKYHGAGNDFILIDDRANRIKLSWKQIKLLCDRRFGIGADGLMLLKKSKNHDFKMIYYNSDGFEGTMCGNGGRCIVAFANYLGIDSYNFEAIDGIHTATIKKKTDDNSELIIKLEMKDVEECHPLTKNSYIVDTGSLHYVTFVKDLDNYPVFEKGRKIRYSPQFEDGINVNFVEPSDKYLAIRTYENGVEDETFACGTGSTATAIVAYYLGIAPHKILKSTTKESMVERVEYHLKAKGGNLKVEFCVNPKNRNNFKKVYLTGPAKKVFECDIEI